MKITPSNELIGAILSDKSEEVLQNFQQNPEEFIATKLGVDVPFDINLVENTEDEINIALPYYSDLEEMTVENIDGDSLENVAGGEVVTTAANAVRTIALDDPEKAIAMGTAIFGEAVANHMVSDAITDAVTAEPEPQGK